MKSIKLTLIYGFLLWLIPFVVAIIIFPLKQSKSPLFETVMPIALTVCVVFFAVSSAIIQAKLSKQRIG